MRARVLALGMVLAWPSLAHANWFVDTIGNPITGGLAQGAHAFGESMAIGARQTRAAFGSAAHGVGVVWPRSAQELAFEANANAPPGEAQWDGFGWRACQTSGCFEGGPTPLPAGGDKMAPNMPLSAAAEPTVKVTIYNNTASRRVIEVYDAKTGAWTNRLAFLPWQKTEVTLHRDEQGRGGAVLRWDHDPRFDVRYSWVGQGDELK
ncbi:MAG TPA: hypothetical protein VMU59_14805 [Caulobacteraceae bacterium]|nr:hypothetical protein [Caulobacteraceae bacterium]